MPGYKNRNALSATRQLPWFYWSGETDMHCLKCAIEDTKRSAYAHHIQRLMVTGNFALLAGVNPAKIEEWYLAVYADAFEWVELPNVHGMVMFADGGLLSSKPYAASGAYINRMSNYCQRCVYDPKIKTGRGACPFNFLYWNFLLQNRSALSRNSRMKMAYQTLDHMDPVKIAAMRQDAHDFLQQINEYRPREFRSDLFDSA
jgi:deoxyribodipyrimidine photolyase-related protein